MNAPRLSRRLNVALLILAGVAAAVVFWPISPIRESAPSSVAASNLRQIGQASLIHASDRRDKLPVAENVWDYAAELARWGGLNDASIWVAPDDPANAGTQDDLGTVLTGNRRELDPRFRTLAPSWAVPLGGLMVNMPATTPIAWTRGLRADGTWAPHSPNGGEGGHIVFLGGNVTYFRDVKGALHRFNGEGMTSNMLEALPPGTRIGEYVPNEGQQAEWARKRRLMKTGAAVGPWIVPGIWLLALVVVSVQTVKGRWSGWVLLWFLGLSLIAAVLTA